MDILGIKIELIDSSTKISGENVFGISKIFFNIRGFFVVKSNCEQSNIQWDILTIDKKSITNSIADTFRSKQKLKYSCQRISSLTADITFFPYKKTKQISF